MLICLGITADTCKYENGVCTRLTNVDQLKCMDLETSKTQVSVSVCAFTKLNNELDACMRDPT